MKNRSDDWLGLALVACLIAFASGIVIGGVIGNNLCAESGAVQGLAR